MSTVPRAPLLRGIARRVADRRVAAHALLALVVATVPSACQSVADQYVTEPKTTPTLGYGNVEVQVTGLPADARPDVVRVTGGSPTPISRTLTPGRTTSPFPFSDRNGVYSLEFLPVTLGGARYLPNRTAGTLNVNADVVTVAVAYAPAP